VNDFPEADVTDTDLGTELLHPTPHRDEDHKIEESFDRRLEENLKNYDSEPSRHSQKGLEITQD
jgi:hypothetical protein